eukprot:g7094.t1 g7094   contig23:1840388-1841331(-)
MNRTLRLALSLLSVRANLCLAFTSPTPIERRHASTSHLGLSPTDDDTTSTCMSSRRSFLNNVISTTVAATAFIASPLISLAEEETPAPPSSQKSKLLPLSAYIYNILRVREATQQETRLINSGKFKDVQRANVKLAVKFIINNYKLSDSVVAASSYLKGNARVSASGVGGSAVQSLYTILEYFDSSDVENIKVGSDSLAGKEAIVTKGLESVRRDIDDFLSYFPQDVIEEAKAKIAEENELNYKEFDPSLGTILNPNPK